MLGLGIYNKFGQKCGNLKTKQIIIDKIINFFWQYDKIIDIKINQIIFYKT